MITCSGLWSAVKSRSLTAQASIDRNKESHPCKLYPNDTEHTIYKVRLRRVFKMLNFDIIINR